MATPNTLFAVVNVSDPAELKARISTLLPWLYLELQDGQWLVVAPTGTTTKELSERLGFADASSKGTALVLRVDNYFGRNYQAVWEWIATKLGAELGKPTTA